MIGSFADKRSAAIFAGHAARGLPQSIQQRARMKLLLIDAAGRLEDLRAPPGHRRGQHSIRVNDRWRICFVWREGAAWQAEIVDYH